MALHSQIRGLRSFCIAAKCLSFKHAASQLFITPSAVSHQIKQLEEQLDIVLFQRNTRSIDLTEKGQQFYQAIQPIISELDTTIDEFTNEQQNKTIGISMPEFFASELFIPKLSEWAKLNPDINLKVETVKATEITKTTSDLSIVLASGKPNASKVHELFPIKYVAACNQQLYQQWHKSGFDALKKVPLILHKSRPWSWHKWADQININDFNPMQIIQLDSMFGVARAAQQGMGIALIPLPMSKAWFEDNSLIKIFDHELITHDKYFLVQQDDIQNRPELTTFSKWVKSNFLSAITA